MIDEADLLLSHGYAESLQSLLKLLPPILQTCLVSATLTSDVAKLKRVMLHKPAVVKLKRQEGGCLKQFYLDVGSAQDKLLVTYVFLKLGVIQGRVIIFTSGAQESYRVKLFLEQFGMRSGVLSGQMTGRHRVEVCDRFNSGGFDILITEDWEDEEEMDDDDEEEEEDDEEEDENGDEDEDEDKDEDEGDEEAREIDQKKRKKR